MINFDEFPDVSKSAWLAQVAKELKEKSLDDLVWYPALGLEASPFVFAGDFKRESQPLSSEISNWEICELITIEDVKSANIQALEALAGGADSLRFSFSEIPETGDFSKFLTKLFQNIFQFVSKGVPFNKTRVQ